MNAEWVEGRDPEVDRHYLVRVEVNAFHFRYASVRKFKDGKWQQMTPGERVVTWLSGVEL